MKMVHDKPLLEYEMRRAAL
jgi:hypothetical protein